MDKEMSEREAFESAIASVWGVPPLDLHQDAYKHLGLFWQAACKWQREKDAEICRQLNLVSDAAWVEGTLDCAAAILNQGSKE